MSLPPFPVLPSPRTWAAGDLILTRYLRGDVSNAVNLLTNPPLCVGSQQTTAQPVANSGRTALQLDTELVDTWGAHQIPNPTVVAPLPGWYLTEGFHSLPITGSGTSTAGIEVTQNGTVADMLGATISAGGTGNPVPTVADLVQLNGVTTVFAFQAGTSGTFNAFGSSFANGTSVILTPAGAALPGGFAAGVVYYVVSVSGSTFQLSTAPGGSPSPVTTAGIGAIQATDNVSLLAQQSSAASVNCAQAWFSSAWVGQVNGTVIPAPALPAQWPPAAGVTLSAGVAAAGTTLHVSNPAGMITGGTLGLSPGTPIAEKVAITGVSGTTIGISPAAYPHLAGSAVAVPVSAAWNNQQIRDQINFLTYPPMARLNNNGVTQSLASQAFPAATAMQFASNSSQVGQAAWLDNFGGWSSSSPTAYTFPLPGIYYVYGQVFTAGNATAFSLCAGLRISGGTTLWGDVAPGASGGGQMCAVVRRHLRVTAGQFVELMGSQNLGSSLSVRSSGATMCRLVVVWRGY